MLELVVAITVASVVIVFLTMFLSAPVNAYFAQGRRADFVDTAERTSRLIRRDIEGALPDSVRQAATGNFRVFDMIAIERTRAGDIARYRVGPPADAQHLSINSADANGFAILGAYFPPGTPTTALPGQRRLIVGRSTSDPYTGVRFMTGPLTVSLASLGQDEELLTTSAAVNFQNASRSNRVFITAQVPTVAYMCDLGTRTLTRYTGFPIEAIALHNTTALLSGKSATSEVIADNVTACTFRPVAPRDGAVVIRGILSYQITLTLDGETTLVFDQVPTELGP
jgi:MSHA biogenesis protein MshO